VQKRNPKVRVWGRYHQIHAAGLISGRDLSLVRFESGCLCIRIHLSREDRQTDTSKGAWYFSRFDKEEVCTVEQMIVLHFTALHCTVRL